MCPPHVAVFTHSASLLCVPLLFCAIFVAIILAGIELHAVLPRTYGWCCRVAFVYCLLKGLGYIEHTILRNNTLLTSHVTNNITHRSNTDEAVSRALCHRTRTAGCHDSIPRKITSLPTNSASSIPRGVTSLPTNPASLFRPATLAAPGGAGAAPIFAQYFWGCGRSFSNIRVSACSPGTHTRGCGRTHHKGLLPAADLHLYPDLVAGLVRCVGAELALLCKKPCHKLSELLSVGCSGAQSMHVFYLSTVWGPGAET